MSLHPLVLALILFTGLPAGAEPWMASRFAENCSSCHAPGRENVRASMRRCSFSCKSCHTNPSGGGLRNFNGKWLEARWLNSLYFKNYPLNKPKPSVEQSYNNQDKLDQLEPEKLAKIGQRGVKLHEATGPVDEKAYKADHPKHVEMNPDMVMAHIPFGDPARQESTQEYNIGTDTRLSYFASNHSSRDGYFFLTDLQGSLQPIKHLTFAIDGRIYTGPGHASWDDQSKKSNGELHEAYALYDGLTYNSYVQYGIYRPQFAITENDHETLLMSAIGLDPRADFTTASIGLEPGVPFFNFHYIQPTSDSAYAQDKGMVFNVGARLRTRGIYGMLSYWNTTSHDAPRLLDIKKQMLALSGGMTYRRYTLGVQLTRVRQEVSSQRKDSGGGFVLDNRYRVWGETYARLTYENLNTALNLNEGKSSALELGVSSYLISSVNVALSFRMLRESGSGSSFNDQTTLVQGHFFY